jgi:hypothetical protein
MADGIRTISLDADDAPDPGATGATGATDTDDFPGVERERPKRTPELRRMETQLADLYVQAAVILGIATGPTGNMAGTVIASKAGVLAESWIDLAERDPRVRRAIKSILQGGGWAGVIAAHVGVALPIAALVGVLPPPVAQKVFMGLMLTEPDLYAQLQAQQEAVRAQAAAAANGATG